MMERKVETKPGEDFWMEEFSFAVKPNTDALYYKFDVRVDSTPECSLEIVGEHTSLPSFVTVEGETLLNLKVRGPRAMPRRVECNVYITTRSRKSGNVVASQGKDHYSVVLINSQEALTETEDFVPPQADAFPPPQAPEREAEPESKPEPMRLMAAQEAAPPKPAQDADFAAVRPPGFPPETPAEGLPPSAPFAETTPQSAHILRPQDGYAAHTSAANVATAPLVSDGVSSASGNPSPVTAASAPAPYREQYAPEKPEPPASAPQRPVASPAPPPPPVVKPVPPSPPPQFEHGRVDRDGRSISVHFRVPSKLPLVFSGAMSAAGSGGFTVYVDGSQVAVSSAEAQGPVVTLKLPSVIYVEQKVTVAYDAAGALQDRAQNPGNVATFIQKSVVNNSVQEPEVIGYGIKPTPDGGTWPSDAVISLPTQLQNGTFLQQDLLVTITPGNKLKGVLSSPDARIKIVSGDGSDSAGSGPYHLAIPSGSYRNATEFALKFALDATITEEIEGGTLTFTHEGGGDRFAPGDPGPFAYNFVGASRQVVVIKALPNGFEVVNRLFLQLWPCKRERVLFEVLNESGKQQKFALDIPILTAAKKGAQEKDPQLNVRISSNDNFVPPGGEGLINKGYYPVYLTADRQYPTGAQNRLKITVTAQETGVKHTFELPMQIKAAACVALTAESLPPERRREEAPTRWCFRTQNRYALTLVNAGNTPTSVRLQATPKSKGGVYDYIFDSQVVNLPAGATQSMNLQVYQREKWGGVFSRHSFEVMAVPVTDETNYKPDETWDKSRAYQPLINTKELQTVKYQIPLWVAGLLLTFLALLFAGNLVAPTDLRIEPNTTGVQVISFDEEKKRIFAVMGQVDQGKPLKASAKWDGWFPAWFSTDQVSSQQPTGPKREQQDVFAQNSDLKGKTLNINYTATPFPYLFGWRGSTAAARYYFTRSDVALQMSVNGKPCPIQNNTVRLTIPKSKTVWLLLDNAIKDDITLNCWIVNDLPTHFELPENIHTIELNPTYHKPKRLGITLNRDAPVNAEEELLLITTDAKHPFVHIVLSAGE